MKALLSPQHIGLLAQLTRAPLLLAFDFDGTLAPIVAAHDAAAMRPVTQQLFSRLCLAYPCAVVSGRSQSDARARLGDAAVQHVVGNHGNEPGADLPALEAEVKAVLPALQAALQPWGVEIENKRYSLTVHTRQAPQQSSVHEAIQRIIDGLPVRMRSLAGKEIINLLPPGSRHKGDALKTLRDLAGAQATLYVGDDITDEDVFALPRAERIVGVRIGHSTDSAAEYFLRDQLEIDALLERLLEITREL